MKKYLFVLTTVVNHEGLTIKGSTYTLEEAIENVRNFQKLGVSTSCSVFDIEDEMMLLNEWKYVPQENAE